MSAGFLLSDWAAQNDLGSYLSAARGSHHLLRHYILQPEAAAGGAAASDMGAPCAAPLPWLGIFSSFSLLAVQNQNWFYNSAAGVFQLSTFMPFCPQPAAPASDEAASVGVETVSRAGAPCTAAVPDLAAASAVEEESAAHAAVPSAVSTAKPAAAVDAVDASAASVAPVASAMAGSAAPAQLSVASAASAAAPAATPASAHVRVYALCYTPLWLLTRPSMGPPLCVGVCIWLYQTVVVAFAACHRVL